MKIGKFKPEYISKMDFYLEALDCQKKENKNPSVGMILCASKDDEVVEHAISRNMFSDDGSRINCSCRIKQYCRN